MGNVVNSHRDLKTQLIISHLRKIYSDGCRGFRCRGVCRLDRICRPDTRVSLTFLARAPWGALARCGVVAGRESGPRSTQIARGPRNAGGAPHATEPRRARRGPARTLRRQDRPTRRITAYGYASSRVCHFSLRDS